MKTIEITRDALGTLIADEAKWYAKATELEAANARLRDENGGLRQARDTYRTHVETANADAHRARDAIRALIQEAKDDAKRRKAGVSEALSEAMKRAELLINEQESTPFLPRTYPARCAPRIATRGRGYRIVDTMERSARHDVLAVRMRREGLPVRPAGAGQHG